MADGSSKPRRTACSSAASITICSITRRTRVGFTSALGAFKIQTFWSNNITFDVKRQYWANFVETGPGFRFRPPRAPASLAITVGVVRGAYLINAGNPRRPNFNDFRAGVWYAFTK